MDFHTTKLSNGLQVIMNKNIHQKSATIVVFINAGSNVETPEVNGIAHFIEHLFFKGTKNRAHQRDIAIEVEKYGGDMNGYTSQESTCYFIKANSDHLDDIIDILGDMINNSLYREEDIEIEKNVVINEIQLSNSKQTSIIEKHMFMEFFKGLPISKPISGYAEIIKKINKFKIYAFLYRFYRPENMVISVSGNFKSYNNLKKTLENNFGNNYHRKYRLESVYFKRMVESLINYEKRWNNILELVKPVYTQKKILYHITPKISAEHTFIQMGFSGVKYDDELNKYKINMLSSILGGGMSSRLFEKVRTKHGLVYTIRSSHDAFNDVGIFNINYTCNHSIQTQIKILNIIKNEIELLKNEPITQLEYDNYITGYENQMKIDTEDSYDNAYNYGKQLLKKIRFPNLSIKTYKEKLKIVKSIKIEDLQVLANQLFDWRNFLVVSYSPNKVFIENYENIFLGIKHSSRSLTKKKSKV